jgi:hypothetical protein
MWGECELIRETRWTRWYAVGDQSEYMRSRFEGGDATIALVELERE